MEGVLSLHDRLLPEKAEKERELGLCQHLSLTRRDTLHIHPRCAEPKSYSQETFRPTNRNNLAVRSQELMSCSLSLATQTLTTCAAASLWLLWMQAPPSQVPWQPRQTGGGTCLEVLLSRKGTPPAGQWGFSSPVIAFSFYRSASLPSQFPWIRRSDQDLRHSPILCLST